MRIDGITRLPARLLSFTSADGELVPTWFGDRDRPWLRDLLDDAEALAGQPFEVWRRRWARGVSGCPENALHAPARMREATMRLRKCGGRTARPHARPQTTTTAAAAVPPPRAACDRPAVTL